MIRLSLYHPDLNPIEIIWPQIKSYVAVRMFHLTWRCYKFMKLNISEIFVNDWDKCCKHVEQTEGDYSKKDEIGQKLLSH